MITWYYILGIISYGIFLIQFLSSFVGGEDIDIDLDGELDFSVSDLVSFKGLIHFLMGFSGWLMIAGKVTIISIIIACVIGILFMIALYYIYKLALSLQSIPTKEEGLGLVGSVVTVYLTMETISEKHCICTVSNGGITEEINCISSSPVKIGDKRIIFDYKNGIYYIS